MGEFSDTCADDLLSVHLQIQVEAISSRDGHDQTERAGLSLSLSLAPEDAAETVGTLKSAARAIRKGCLFGWMHQKIAEIEMDAGTLRPMTAAESINLAEEV